MKKIFVIFILIFAGCATTSGNVDKRKLAEGYYMKGLSYLEQKNYELAMVEFQRSIQTDSKNKWSYYGLGIISDMQGKFDEAVKYYQEAIDVDEDFSEAHNALGVVYFKQQKWKKAAKSFKRALDNKLYTTPHLPYLNLGDLYAAQKEYDKAIEAYRESKRFVNQDITIMKLGDILMEAGMVKEAVNEFLEGVSMSPGNPLMRYRLGLALLKVGKKKAALSEFNKVVKLAPQSEEALKAQDYINTLR